MRKFVVAATLGGVLFAGAPAWAQTTENQPPTAPGNPRVVDVTPFSAVLEWDASTDDRDGSFLGYTVYGPPDGTFGDKWGWAVDGATSAFVGRLTPGTTYTFTVRAMDSWARQSEHSEPVTVTTEAIDPLPVPANVRVTRNATGTEVDLAFDAADDPRVSFYNIKRDGRQIGFTWSGDKTFTGTGLEPETAYEFQVASVLSNHFEGPLSEPVRVTTARDSVAPTAPRRLAILDRTGTSVDLQWESATDNVRVTEFVVSNGSETRTMPATSSFRTSFEFEGLAPETPFTFTVRARDAAGNLSPPSNAQTIATGVHPDVEPPAPVTGLAVEVFWEEEILVRWNRSTDNVTLQPRLKYRLSFENGASVVTDRTSMGAFIDGTPLPLFGCVPTVRAIDRAGNESEPRSVRWC